MEEWWQDAIIYAVDVERFYDSNDDGIGDFPGLTARLDYIAGLGVTCVWLLPFYESTNRDNGYDITGYFSVDPRYGTLDDFIAFIHQAGELGIRVIVDLVVNHTSDKHPWFQAARHNDQSRYRDYYYWSGNPPPTPEGKGTIFPGEENSIWSYDEVARAFYYHRFYHFEPSLNTHNADVRKELERVLDFWMSFGISGFRVDAAAHMVEAPSAEYQTMEDPHETLRKMHGRAKAVKSDSVLIGEVDEDPETLKKFLDGGQLDMMFNFLLNNYLFLSLATGEAGPVKKAMAMLPPLPEHGQWTNFLRNLDEVDLEQLTEAEREIIYDKFAPKKEMRIYGRGMRRRLASALGGDIKHIKLAYSLLFAMPGAPCFVYGDEIGMGEDLGQAGRYSVRAPMQWSEKKSGGFSKAPKAKLVQPMIEEGKFSYKKVNVAAQKENDDSLLAFITSLSHMRRRLKIIRQANCHVLSGLPDHILAVSYKDKDQYLIMLHNLIDEKTQGSVAIPADVAQLDDLFDRSRAEADIDNGQLRYSLPPYGFRWLGAPEG